MAPFCSCPVSLVSRKFFAVVPGCAKLFFFCCALLGAATFRRARAKKTPPRVCIFLLRPRRKAGEGEAPLGAGTGPEQKKTPWVVVFLLWPRRKVAAPNGAQQKKNFAHPETTAKTVVENKDTGHEQKGATTKKKTTHSLRPWTAMLTHFFSGATFPAGAFFFCCGPARTLTHPLRSWAAMPPAGVVFFFLLRPRPDRGGFFFLLWPRPDAHSLTVRWGDFGKALVIFFCCGPAEPGEPITKNVW